MPSQGGDAFPLSYGDFDNVAPRWSPDGKLIAFISNRGGNTSLWTQEIPGGAQTPLVPKERHYLKPVGRLRITVLDPAGHLTPARVFVTGEDGRAYAPDDAWMRADDSFVRAERPFEAHYFHTAGNVELTLPAGNAEVEVMKGFEYGFERKSLSVTAGQQSTLTVRLQPLNLPTGTRTRWVSGDVHVHMNYGGAYRDTPERLVAQAAAENLSIVEDLVVATDTPGFHREPMQGKELGHRASEHVHISLKNCRVHKSALLGAPGEGFKVAMSALDRGRLGVAAGALGIAQACLDACIDYTKQRHQFGQRIADFQMIQASLANMAADVEAARLLVYRAAWLKDQGLPTTRATSIAKLFATEAAMKAASEAVLMHGNRGYSNEYPVERYYRDIKGLQIYEGTSHIQRIIIARELVGRSR